MEFSGMMDEVLHRLRQFHRAARFDEDSVFRGHDFRYRLPPGRNHRQSGGECLEDHPGIAFPAVVSWEHKNIVVRYNTGDRCGRHFATIVDATGKLVSLEAVLKRPVDTDDRLASQHACRGKKFANALRRFDVTDVDEAGS